jgi:hypothetical protein
MISNLFTSGSTLSLLSVTLISSRITSLARGSSPTTFPTGLEMAGWRPFGGCMVRRAGVLFFGRKDEIQRLI